MIKQSFLTPHFFFGSWILKKIQKLVDCSCNLKNGNKGLALIIARQLMALTRRKKVLCIMVELSNGCLLVRPKLCLSKI